MNKKSLKTLAFLGLTTGLCVMQTLNAADKVKDAPKKAATADDPNDVLPTWTTPIKHDSLQGQDTWDFRSLKGPLKVLTAQGMDFKIPKRGLKTLHPINEPLSTAPDSTCHSQCEMAD